MARRWRRLRPRARLEDRIATLERTLEKTRRAAEKGLIEPRVSLDYPHAHIVLGAPGKHARKRRKAVAKEPFTVDWLETLPAGDVLYDIGANIGAYSLIAAKRRQGPMRVVAIEPAFANYAQLCANVVLIGVEDYVMPLPVTLGAATALSTLSYWRIDAGAAHHAAGVDPVAPPQYSQRVLAYRLDDLIEQFGLPAPAHVKIDVDGAELLVLSGGRRVLDDPRTQSVLLEAQPELQSQADAFLRDCGMRPTDRFERRSDGRLVLAYTLYRR